MTTTTTKDTYSFIKHRKCFSWKNHWNRLHPLTSRLRSHARQAYTAYFTVYARTRAGTYISAFWLLSWSRKVEWIDILRNHEQHLRKAWRRSEFSRALSLGRCFSLLTNGTRRKNISIREFESSRSFSDFSNANARANEKLWRCSYFSLSCRWATSRKSNRLSWLIF